MKSKQFSKKVQNDIDKALEVLDQGLPADGEGFLGVDFPVEAAKLVLLAVPWDATTSYGAGTKDGPDAIRRASHQIDAFDLSYQRAYRSGIAWSNEIADEIDTLNTKASKLVGELRKKSSQSLLKQIDEISEGVNELVYSASCKYLKNGQAVAVVGGDHSAPLGLIRALGEKYKDFGILHIDAHFDLRKAYEGMTYSHASIMYNVISEVKSVSRLVPVGIRDFSAQEYRFAKEHGARIRTYFDQDMAKLAMQGITFHDIIDQIIRELPENIYISFDIDGLDPSYCPSTGTPVPGGLQFMQVAYLLESIVDSKRKVIGFDLCEVAPSKHNADDEWDANVGARLCYRLSTLLLRS